MKPAALLLPLLLVSACAPPPAMAPAPAAPVPHLAVEQTAAQMQLERHSRPLNRQEADVPVIVQDGFYIPNTLLHIPPQPIDLAISAPTELRQLLEAVAETADWSVHFMPDTDPARKVKVHLSNADFAAALADIAGLAGYTTVFDSAKRRVSIARRAVWTFRFPPHIVNAVQWQYSAGGDPVQAQGGSDGGQLQGALEAASTISGRHQQDAQRALAFIREAVNAGNAAGEAPAVIAALPPQGLMVVRGNAAQLARAEQLLQRLIDDATTRVEINAAIVEVSAQDSSEIGIDWKKIINADRQTLKQVELTGRRLVNSNFTATITKRSLNFVLNALNTRAKLNIVTRPNLLVDNHTPADLVDATTVPYLSSVDATIDENNRPSYSFDSAQAVSGLKISVLPHVFSPTQVKLMLLPFLGDVPNFQTFDYGDNTVTLPTQLTKQALLSVTLADGETLVLAGNRIRSSRRDRDGLPLLSTPLTDSVARQDLNKEVAILLAVRILPPAAEPVLLSKAL